MVEVSQWSASGRKALESPAAQHCVPSHPTLSITSPNAPGLLQHSSRSRSLKSIHTVSEDHTLSCVSSANKPQLGHSPVGFTPCINSSADHFDFKIAVTENPIPCSSLQQSVTFSALWWGFSCHCLTSSASAHFPLLAFCISSRWPLRNTAQESNSFNSRHTDSLEPPLAFYSCPLSTKFNMNHIDFVLV